MNQRLKSLMLPFLTSAAYLGLLKFESAYPLRNKTEKVLLHESRNLLIAGLSGFFLSLTERPLMKFLTRKVNEKKIGFLSALGMSAKLEMILGIVLLDYTLYHWHVLNHKVKFLWRFHEVHHQDLDMTVSTGIRFHFMEMLLSVIWRSMQVLIIGIKGQTLKLWQALTLIEIMFHHSNIRIPLKIERIINFVLVTPRMHTIHHSIKMEETNSNWSSGLTLWDYLHNTLRTGVDLQNIIIGSPTARGQKLDLIGFIKKPFSPEVIQ